MMEQVRKWLPYLVGVVIIIVLSIFLFKGCNDQKTETKTIYKEGKETIKTIPGVPDTVTKYIPYPVYVEKPKGDHYGKDSSTYTIVKETGRVDITTYPATDSIRVEVEPVTIERLITKVDSVLITRIDTLQITTTTQIEQPWYDTFLTGFFTAILTVAGVIGALAL